MGFESQLLRPEVRARDEVANSGPVFYVAKDLLCILSQQSALSHLRNRDNGDERRCTHARNKLLAWLMSWQEETSPTLGRAEGRCVYSLLWVFFLVCNRTLLSLIPYIQSEAFLMFGAQPQPPCCVHEVFPAVLNGSAN